MKSTSFISFTAAVAFFESILIQNVSANAVFFCQSRTDPNAFRYGDLTFYQGCKPGACDCSFIELICLKNAGFEEKEGGNIEIKFSMNSESYSYAKSCPKSDCLCNLDEERWAT